MTNVAILATLTLLCYGLAIFIRLRQVSTQTATRLAWLNPVSVFTVAGIMLHAQNLAFFNLFSLVAWLVLFLITITALKKWLGGLLIIALPIAATSVVLPLIFPQTDMINTGADPKVLAHILLSTFTFSVLCIAALQALLLGMQEWLFRHHQSSMLIQLLPPLELMEQLLFRLIISGFILLSSVLISSVIVFQPLFVSPIWQKLLLSLFAWIVFAILLIGRWRFGWRGRLAIRSTLIGVTVITLVYFGSALI
jgi:ABC-type uncharacterized transport system permease subunit